MAEAVLAGTPAGASFPTGWFGLLTVIPAWESATRDEKERSARQHLLPALRASLKARDLCPLMSRPHVLIAAKRPYFAKADPRTAYLDRAKRLITNDAEMWFVFGFQELVEGEKERAVASWRQSLGYSDLRLKDILELARNILSSDTLNNQLLPDQPELLVRAAIQSYPGPDGQAHAAPSWKGPLDAWKHSRVLGKRTIFT